MTEKTIKKRVKQLSNIYSLSRRKIVAELLSMEDFTIREKQRVLKDLDAELRRLVGKSDKWYSTHLKSAYKEGEYDVVDYLKRIGVKGIVYDTSDAEMVEQLIKRSHNYTREAISGIRRNTSMILDDLTIKRIQQIMAEDTVGSISLKEIKGDLVDYLMKKGVTIRDSAGRRWELESYAEMIARTDLMNSYNQGVASQILHSGGDLAYITSYASCECKICLEWEGEVVSITGKTAGYRTLDDAYGEGLFHPNCKHNLRPYIEEFWKES